MTKLLVAALIALTGLTAHADNGFYLYSRGANTSLWAEAMSSSGQYMACWLYGYSAVLDTKTGTVYIYSEESEFFDVSDLGTMVGYGAGNVIGYNIDGTTVSPTGGGIARGISNDDSIIVGCTYNSDWTTNACYWKDGVRTLLPLPDEAEFGFEINQGSVALSVSDDGAVIAGYVIDNLSNWVGVLWFRNSAGEYWCDPICIGEFAGDDTDGNYYVFEPKAVSPNGKYVAFDLVDSNGDDISYWGRYDTAKGKMTICKPDSYDYYATAIADDGTIVGYRGSSSLRFGAIWYAEGETIEALADVFPEIDMMLYFDEVDQFNCPVGISADGRYIGGMAWTAFDDEDEYYARRCSWMIDTEEYAASAGVRSVTMPTATTAAAAVYNTAGVRLSGMQKGLNIVRENGKTVKVIKK